MPMGSPPLAQFKRSDKMFKYRSINDQLIEERNKNTLLNMQLEQAQANIDYIAMMSDIELEEEGELENVNEISESEEIL